jgi:hypothetical protein
MNPLNPVTRPCEKKASARQGKESMTRGDKLSAKEMLGPIAAACLWSAGLPAGVFAQDWRRDEFEYMREPHHFGPLCEYGIRARGSVRVLLFAVWRGAGSAQGRGAVDRRLRIRGVAPVRPALGKLRTGDGQGAALRPQGPGIGVRREHSSLPPAVM